MHDVEVEDVDGGLGSNGFEDGLVGCQVGESNERGYLVEGKVGGVEEGLVGGGDEV